MEEKDYALSEKMVRSWTDFIKEGDPGWTAFDKAGDYSQVLDVLRNKWKNILATQSYS